MICPGIIDQHVTVLQDEALWQVLSTKLVVVSNWHVVYWLNLWSSILYILKEFLHAAMRDYCLVVCVPEYGKSMFSMKCVNLYNLKEKLRQIQNSNTEFLKNEEKLCWIAMAPQQGLGIKYPLDRFESLSA